MSHPHRFHATAGATVELWDKWVDAARTWVRREQIPSILELQTICRETGVQLPELDSFAAVRNQPPMLMLCGGDNLLAADVCAAIGIHAVFPVITDAPIVWRVIPADSDSLRLRHGEGEREISRHTLLAFLSGNLPKGSLVHVDEQTPSPSNWTFCWVPHPAYVRIPDDDPSAMPLILGQRAAFVIHEDTPELYRETLEELGQKLWVVAREDANTVDERRRLLAEVATLVNDRPEDIEIRVTAVWRWLSLRLLDQIAEKKRHYQQIVNQQELKLNSIRHLFSQYRTNWAAGVRSLAETHFQTRLSSAAIAAFLDVQKPGPAPDTFLQASGLPALWTRMEEYVTDRMADFVTGLSGLSTRLDLRRISLNDAKVRWEMRKLGPRLETILAEKRIFPAGGGKRGGLVGNLTGRKQVVLDERRAQISKASRTMVQYLELEFSNWCGVLMSTVESGITLQLTAALANQGLPDAESIVAAHEGLERIEKALRGGREGVRSPEAVAAEWLELLTSRRLIPLYQPPALQP